MIIDQRYRLLKHDKRGSYLLERGDNYTRKGNINKAIKYYKEAKKYNDSEAQERLNQYTRYLSTVDAPSLTESSQDSKASVIIDASKTQSIGLTGPYFPSTKSSDPFNNHASLTESYSQHDEHIKFSLQDAPSTLVVANMFRSSTPEKRAPINKLIHKIIQQYDGSFSSPESIQELGVLATIPDEQVFIAIITQLLKVEMSSPTFPELTINGLAVILTCTPIELQLTDRQGLLSSILERLQYRLENTRIENNTKELLPLMRALSALFDAMLCRNMRHLARENVYNTITSRLSEIASDDTVDPEVSFLAHYSVQSLSYIGNDESLSMSIFRRGRLAIGIIMDIKSLVFDIDPGMFESIYNRVIDMSDYTIKLKWYQGLLFIDCLLGREDLSGLEKFIIESKLKSSEYFMQGVCLRIEQLATSHSNDQVVQGSIRLLQDIESHSTGLTQKIASASLRRLKVNNHGESISSAGHSGSSSIETNVNTQLYSSSKLSAIWDKYWYSDPNSFLLKSVQAIEKGNLNMQNASQSFGVIQEEIKKLAPTSSSISEVHRALVEYYATKLTIRRVSGEELGLELCYINLAIVEATRQREGERKEMEAQAKSFIRLQNYEQVLATNTAKPIPLNEILNERRLINGSVGQPKRILIIGRAGVGKTTLCKKLVHTFQSGHWNDRFGAILWIPLRQLKQYKSRNLGDLLLEKYFIRGDKNEREGLAQEFIRSAKNGKVLFLLDGLDEFVGERGVDDPSRDFLISLLEHPNVIITTRPYGSDKSLLRNLDLELETVGFSKEDVEKYVRSVVNNTDESNSVLEFIQKTPLIQGLVNIPVQLDLICYSWNDLLTTNSTTVAQLYRTIVRKLWCKDAIKLGKKIDDDQATIQLMKDLHVDEIEEHMTTLVEYLGYLAYQGLRNNHTIIFNQTELLSAMNALRQHKKKTGQNIFPRMLEEVKRSSVLHTTDNAIRSGTESSQETWNFIHLTFQEYFAATWLSRYFQDQDRSSGGRSLLMDREGTLSFIRLNKYNPRFEIVWWMIAGQLEGSALESYFQLLQNSPRDLIGSRHAILLVGCHKEAESQLSPKTNDLIQNELFRWLEFEMSICGGKETGSKLVKQRLFHDNILIRCLNRSSDMQRYILASLHSHKFLATTTIDRLIQIIQDKGRGNKSASFAISILGSQISLSDQAASVLVQALKDKFSVRIAAHDALKNQPTLPNTAITLLVATLYDADPDVRIAAGDSLSYQSAFSESTAKAILDALQDDDSGVKIAAAHAFCGESTHPKSVTSALLALLNDDDPSVRSISIKALGRQVQWSGSVSTAIIAALQDGSRDVRIAAANACTQKKSSFSAAEITTLVNVMRDSDLFTCEGIAKVLFKESTLPESAILSLYTAFQVKNSGYKTYAIEILGIHSRKSDALSSSLVSAIQDENSLVRAGAIAALSYHSDLQESIVSTLFAALQDVDLGVRREAATAICKQSTLSDTSVATLFTALQDNDLSVIKEAFHTLVNQSTISKHFFSHLRRFLHHENRSVRRSAVHIIGKHVTLPDLLYSTLVDALKDPYYGVRYQAVELLINRDELPEYVIEALVPALQDDSHEFIRSAATMLICNQPTITVTATSAIITSLPYDSDIVDPYESMLGDSKIFSQMKNLSEDEIEKFYRYSLLEYSCEHPVSLFLHGGRLHIYTRQGHDELEISSEEEMKKIVSSFVSLQKTVGVDMSDIYSQ